MVLACRWIWFCIFFKSTKSPWIDAWSWVLWANCSSTVDSINGINSRRSRNVNSFATMLLENVCRRYMEPYLDMFDSISCFHSPIPGRLKIWRLWSWRRNQICAMWVSGGVRAQRISSLQELSRWSAASSSRCKNISNLSWYHRPQSPCS